MQDIGIVTVGDLYALDMATLEQHFGRYGRRLYELARGTTTTLLFQIARANRSLQKYLREGYPLDGRRAVDTEACS